MANKNFSITYYQTPKLLDVNDTIAYFLETFHSFQLKAKINQATLRFIREHYVSPSKTAFAAIE